MGWLKLLSTPGKASRLWSISSRIFSFDRPRVHSAGGFRSTKTSSMLIGLGSEPSSGRPALEITVLTSGVLCRMARTWAQRAMVSSTEMPAGRLRLTQIAPSLSSGRNSEPRFGTSAKLAPSATSATVITTQRWRRDQARMGR